MSVIDLTLIAGKGVAVADALRDGRSDPVRTISAAFAVMSELQSQRRMLNAATPAEREIYFATGFLLQMIERWARYAQYENEKARSVDWGDKTYAFVELVKNAVARERERAPA